MCSKSLAEYAAFEAQAVAAQATALPAKEFTTGSLATGYQHILSKTEPHRVNPKHFRESLHVTMAKEKVLRLRFVGKVHASATNTVNP